MSKLLESLENYFRNTPKEQLDKDWEEIEYLNEIGPDVFEYAEFVKNQHFIPSCWKEGEQEKEYNATNTSISVDK